MRILGVIDEDFANYKKPSMFISTITCNWKCGREVCQNAHLEDALYLTIPDTLLISRYLDNPLTQAIVFGGLEPLDQFEELVDFIWELRQHTEDDVVVYSGYNADEVGDKLPVLSKFSNIIVKLGRYVPNSAAVFDDILGVALQSSNQCAIKLDESGESRLTRKE